MQRRLCQLILVGFWGIVACSAAPAYKLSVLPLPPGFVMSRACDINSHGEVAGWAATEEEVCHAVVWRNGQVIDLGTLGGSESMAEGISDSGLVAGTFVRGTMRGVFVWRAGQAQELGMVDETPTKLGAGQFRTALGISRRGKVIGRIMNKEGCEITFLYENGQMTYIKGPKGAAAGFGRAINDRGDIAGQHYFRIGLSHAMIWREGQATVLPSLGESIAGAEAINEHGTVAGWSFVPGTPRPTAHAFVVREGKVLDLGTLGGDTSRAYGLNEADQITGYASTETGDNFGFLWEDGVMKDLNKLVISSLGWKVSCGDAINNHGEIAAFGWKDRKSRACLLSPAEPLFASHRAVKTPYPNTSPAGGVELVQGPRLRNFGFTGAGEFRLEFDGREGDFTVETSTDLVHWRTMGGLQRVGERMVIVDINAGESPIRFYRLATANPKPR